MRGNPSRNGFSRTFPKVKPVSGCPAREPRIQPGASTTPGFEFCPRVVHNRIRRRPEGTVAFLEAKLLRAGKRGVRLALAVVLLGGLSAVQPALAAQSPDATEAYRPIHGRILDRTGTGVAGAKVVLDGGGRPEPLQVLSGSDGQFLFPTVAPGLFHLTVSAAGFASQEFSAVLGSEEFTVPDITLALASVVTEVRVVPRSKWPKPRSRKRR